MTEHPILFNSEMVKAILEGRKTQTCRVIKPQPIGEVISVEYWLDGLWRIAHEPAQAPIGKYVGLRLRCPYGITGDRLWVREKFALECPYPDTPECGHPDHVVYWASCSPIVQESITARWRPSIFMPRWASRITLEVLAVQVEQVQDMGENDAIAEGITPLPDEHHLTAFVKLWNSINAKRGFNWDVNPWVWVIEFKVIEPR